MKEYIFKFAKIRKQKSISQIKLAKSLGVTQQHISAYERGERTPSIDIAKKIADALGVKVDDLIVPIEKKE